MAAGGRAGAHPPRSPSGAGRTRGSAVVSPPRHRDVCKDAPMAKGAKKKKKSGTNSSKTGKGGAVPQAEVAGNGALPAEQVTPDAQLSGKAAKKAEKKRKKAAKARGDKAVEPVTWSDVLRVGPGFSLADLDPASTPGLPRGQGRRRGRHGRAPGEARRPPGAALRGVQGRRPALGAPRHPGHGHLGQGRDHAPRRRRRRPAGRRHHLVQGAERGGATPPVPVADPPRAAAPRHGRRLRPQPLRGRPHRPRPRPRARARPGRAATRRSTPSSRASSTTARPSSR